MEFFETLVRISRMLTSRVLIYTVSIVLKLGIENGLYMGTM